MIDHLQTAGKVFLDAGAVQKVLKDGKSLLPIGATEIQGDFRRGDVIACFDAASGQEIARGLSNYSSSDAQRILRHKSSEIADILGYHGAPELIHRDNMVLL
jgi:glutamate 5-kinase